MQLHGFVQVFLGGMAGVLLMELLKLAAWRDKGVIIGKYCETQYWIGTAALLLISGFVAVMKCGDHASLGKAIQLGINAPAIIGGYATAATTRRRRREPAHFAPQPEGAPASRTSLTELLSW